LDRAGGSLQLRLERPPRHRPRLLRAPARGRCRMTRRWSRPHYASLDDAGAEQHPVDTAVEARLPLLDERRRLNELGSRLLDALGEDRHLYLAFEAQRNAVAAAREAAYFDLGVEHGAAVASAGVLGDEGALTLARRL